jgi:cytochrome b involved in lipid metabolism
MNGTGPALNADAINMTCDIISVEECERQHGSSLSVISHSARKSIRDARHEQERKFNERLRDSRSKKGEKIVTRGEAAMHNRPNDLYIIIRGTVYDVTSFLDFHPGGPKALLQLAGMDGTTAFEGKKSLSKKHVPLICCSIVICSATDHLIEVI